MNRWVTFLVAVLATGSFAGFGGVAPPAQASHGLVCSTQVTHANWDFCWQLDEMRSQGLEVLSAHYQHVRAFYRVGFPFSLTVYPGGGYGPYKDVLGSASSSHPGYQKGAITIAPSQCPRFLPTGTLYANGKVCVEKQNGPQPATAVWSRWDIYNYRWIQGYIFRADGTFEPKILLGGRLIDSCAAGGSICQAHYHYLHWRFDVDIGTGANDRVQEFAKTTGSVTNQHANTPCPPPAGSAWCTLSAEAGRDRVLSSYTKWRVWDDTSKNSKNHGRSVELVVGSQGSVDATSTNDVWALAFHGSSSEVGYEVPKTPTTGDAPVNAYVNGESLNPADVVLWYSEKIYHEPRDEDVGTAPVDGMMYHVAGPTWRLRNFLGGNNVESTYPIP